MIDDTFHPMDPDQQLGYLLVRAGEVVSRPWLDGLRQHGINPRQFSVLALIANDPQQSQAELARRVFVTPQSMSELLARLQSLGLVERTVPVPGLAARVDLTSAARELLMSAYPQVERLSRQSVAALSAAEQDQLAGLLQKIIAAHVEVPVTPV